MCAAELVEEIWRLHWGPVCRGAGCAEVRPWESCSQLGGEDLQAALCAVGEAGCPRGDGHCPPGINSSKRTRSREGPLCWR